MGYSHIGIEERCEIARLLKAGTTIRQIAASLDRSPSAISREVNRNRLTSGEYRPVQANERAQARRWRGPRLDRDDLLREAVLWRLAWGASPDQVAGRLALEMGRPALSDETTYRFNLRAGEEEEGLRLAALPAAGEGEAGPALPQGAQFRRVHP